MTSNVAALSMLHITSCSGCIGSDAAWNIREHVLKPLLPARTVSANPMLTLEPTDALSFIFQFAQVGSEEPALR